MNNLAGSEFLEFTAEIWGSDKDDGRKHKAVKAKKDYFLFLDMEMYWSPKGTLQCFRVHFDKICTASHIYVHVLSLCHLYALVVT